MGKVTLYECDHCGERFGARNDVAVIPVRDLRSGTNPVSYFEYDIVLCTDAIDEAPYFRPRQVNYIAVKQGTILGVQVDDTRNGRGHLDETVPRWIDRGDAVYDHYEDFWRYLEGGPDAVDADDPDVVDDEEWRVIR